MIVQLTNSASANKGHDTHSVTSKNHLPKDRRMTWYAQSCTFQDIRQAAQELTNRYQVTGIPQDLVTSLASARIIDFSLVKKMGKYS